jgi:hypothetical protein
MRSRMILGSISVICLGTVVLFVFFAALGGVDPGEALWATVVVASLAVLLVVRSLIVRHELGEHGNSEIRSVNRLRERRGF